MSTPESADCALLDVFTVMGDDPAPEIDAPLMAGKINLNTQQEPVLRAVLKGSLKGVENSSQKSAWIGTEEAYRLARILVERTRSNKPWQGPLINPSELVGKLIGKNRPDLIRNAEVYSSNVRRSACDPKRNLDFPEGAEELAWHFSGLSHDIVRNAHGDPAYRNPRILESAIRALADTGQTRVWNLMIDVIVQTIKAGPPQQHRFKESPTSEVRAWVHLAIDRLTGDVLDVQWEWIDE
jgi:hypothetical protein